MRDLPEAHHFAEWDSNAFRVGVGAAPLSGFLPDGVHGTDPASQWIHDLEITQHLLLVRDGYAESGDGQLFSEGEEVFQVERR
jgi:hypothetical protein